MRHLMGNSAADVSAALCDSLSSNNATAARAACGDEGSDHAAGVIEIACEIKRDDATPNESAAIHHLSWRTWVHVYFGTIMRP